VVSESATSCVPPAPRLEMALYIPVVAKQVIPMSTTCAVGVLDHKQTTQQWLVKRKEVMQHTCTKLGDALSVDVGFRGRGDGRRR
jgi:hypothetical protein